MELTSRFEVLMIICLVGVAIGGILVLGNFTPEIRLSGFVSLSGFIIILISMVVVLFKDGAPQKDRSLPAWYIIGLFLISTGIIFSDPVIGISLVLIGMIIMIYAIHHRERKKRDIVQSDIDNLE